MKNDYSEQLEIYENICNIKGNDDDNIEGMRVIASFCAIGKWLRLELELTHIEVWRQSVALARLVIGSSYGLTKDQTNEANNAGISLAIGCHGADPEYFRGFLKDLGITGVTDQLTQEGKGDLITLLQIFSAIIEEYEPADRISKYTEDIEAICVHQLEGLTIKTSSREIAYELFENYKDKLQSNFPVPNLVEIEDSLFTEIADIVGFTELKKDD